MILIVKIDVKLCRNRINLFHFSYRQLTGMSIATQADALKAMQILHNKGPTTVVLSSTSLGAEGVLLGLASSVKSKFP